MNVLVTGGAGYIGSHLVRVLAEAGHHCVLFDNLCSGHAESVEGFPLVRGDLTSDSSALVECMHAEKIEAVIHLAAFIEAGESAVDPAKYFNNNTIGGLRLLEAMRRAGVGKMVFSSTAAVYGSPRRVPIQETDRLEPINPYGASKLCMELMLRGFAAAHDMGFVALRYFNVAGASPDGRIGEAHRSETHLIPLVLQVAQGKRPHIGIFGEDYDTPDGTCIRDYIHVMDLAAAHVLALEAATPGQFRAYNLGNGEGFSVKQIIETCRQVTGHAIPAKATPRRPGDPDRLVADSTLAQRELRWQPQYAAIETIVEHAWNWHKSHPNGYGV